MRLDLSGKVAVITGASRGIGRQTALTLAGAGATVVLTSRGDAAAAVAAEVTASGGQALAIAADVADAEAVHRVVETTTERFGRLDVLVNNAGITRDQLLLRMKRDDWDAVLATNLTGTFLCTQAVLKTMVKQRSGRIISISSDAQANWASAIPLGRLGTPEDVAAAVCFLASDAAGYITGQVLAVNGGMYA